VISLHKGFAGHGLVNLGDVSPGDSDFPTEKPRFFTVSPAGFSNECAKVAVTQIWLKKCPDRHYSTYSPLN
jgi:hypothetical protein